MKQIIHREEHIKYSCLIQTNLFHKNDTITSSLTISLPKHGNGEK